MIGRLQRSLKTRVTLFSLVIFVLSLWVLAYYASKMLRTDMEQLLGDQRRSTVALVAGNIDQELKDRLSALEGIAADFDERELKSPATLQGILERRPILPLLSTVATSSRMPQAPPPPLFRLRPGASASTTCSATTSQRRWVKASRLSAR